tara:strand:+ start:235 stop:795 length:561 start_codon:yes stop_codon:yes gene_type:complete
MNYQLGHIYKIVCNLDNSFCYIGSTFLSLDKRWQDHIYGYKYKYGEFSIHKYFDTFGIENFKIKLIKSYNVVRVDNKDHKHLWAYETLWINKNKTCVNTQLPFSPMKYLNQKESNKKCNKKRYEKNKEKIAKQNKKYRENNKDKLNEKFNCDCGGKYTKQSIARHLKTKIHIKFIENEICNNAIMQ